jgi:hypothetical protein
LFSCLEAKQESEELYYLFPLRSVKGNETYLSETKRINMAFLFTFIGSKKLEAEKAKNIFFAFRSKILAKKIYFCVVA